MKKTVAILTMEKADNRVKDSVGSSRIRCRWLLNYWPEAEEYLIGKEYPVIVFQKVYWENMMRSFEGIKILDICDADWLEKKPVFEYIDMADATVTSTPALAEYVQKLRPNALVRCIPDRIYLPEHQPVHLRHKGRAESVVWYGYHQNTHYLLKTLDHLLERHLNLTVICDHDFNPGIGFQNIMIKNIPYSYPDVHRRIVEHDIVLMPETTDDIKGRYKSNNKSLTAKALRVPVASLPADLERLLDSEEREREAEAGYQEVLDRWLVQRSVEEYKQLIGELVKKA